MTGRYAYWLKVELAAGSQATFRDLQVRSTFVASPLALPGRLSKGQNRITFVGGIPTVPVTTTCRWTERHQSDLGVSLDAISFYLNDDNMHRNLIVVPPGRLIPLKVTQLGRAPYGKLSLENLPAGWTVHAAESPTEANRANVADAEFVVRPAHDAVGDVETLDMVVTGASPPRRVKAHVLFAPVAISRESEQADETDGDVQSVNVAELSGAAGMQFHGDGQLAFHIARPLDGTFALWLRARWEPESSTSLTLTLNEGRPRRLRAMAMIGLTDWTDRRYAHTKMFAHFGEQYSHWAWYRIPDVSLEPGTTRLTLGARAGAWIDAVLLLPQTPAVDRAAMNLFQNWSYAPWNNPR